MLILGIDTSGRQGSVALLRVQGEKLFVLEQSLVEGGQYSERLVPTIAELLVRQKFERSSIDLIAVASGPGSFTGLRIAIATANGLAEAFTIPVVAVSVLEALAFAAEVEGTIISALDAQRSEVFSGEYVITRALSEFARMHREALTSFEEFTSLLGPTGSSPKVFTPDAGLAARLQEVGVEVKVLPRPGADDFARIAHRKFLAGVHSDIATLDANYLRRSDAEILMAPNGGC